jgi:hypothetical protein
MPQMHSDAQAAIAASLAQFATNSAINGDTAICALQQFIQKRFAKDDSTNDSNWRKERRVC